MGWRWSTSRRGNSVEPSLRDSSVSFILSCRRFCTNRSFARNSRILETWRRVDTGILGAWMSNRCANGQQIRFSPNTQEVYYHNDIHIIRNNLRQTKSPTILYMYLSCAIYIIPRTFVIECFLHVLFVTSFGNAKHQSQDLKSIVQIFQARFIGRKFSSS